jgi:hypothetical protein
MKKIVRYAGLILIIFLVTIFMVNAYNSNPGVILNRVFKNNGSSPKILTYRIYIFGLFPAGQAVFYDKEAQKLNGRDVFHLKAEAGSLDLFSAFFKAEAILDSFIDQADYKPVLFRQKIAISDRPTQEKEVIYDQKQGTMTLNGVERQIMPDTYDPLSLMFDLKRRDFEKNKTIELGINTNQKNYVFKGSVEAKDMLIKGFKYKVYSGKAEIKRRDKNNPYHRSQVTMWLVKIGEENVPVLIRVFASGFIVQIRLVDAR